MSELTKDMALSIALEYHSSFSYNDDVSPMANLHNIMEEYGLEKYHEGYTTGAQNEAGFYC